MWEDYEEEPRPVRREEVVPEVIYAMGRGVLFSNTEPYVVRADRHFVKEISKLGSPTPLDINRFLDAAMCDFGLFRLVAVEGFPDKLFYQLLLEGGGRKGAGRYSAKAERR